MLLADLGAEVIKVEPPLAPDFTRGTGAARNGMTAYFYNTNRGKKAISIDGRHPAGQKILSQLADRSDVLVQNMRPGKAAGIGLDPEECLARNPSLVYASISGYGQTGAASGDPVYDYVIQAVTGMVDAQRDPSTGLLDLTRHFPADKITAHTMSEAILAALFARERDEDKRGQHIEVSMHEANLAFMWPDSMMQHSIVGEPDEPGLYPADFYRVYPTLDGAIVIMPLMTPSKSICQAIGRHDLIEGGRYSTLDSSNLHDFQEIIADCVKHWSSDKAIKTFRNHEVPVGEVLSRANIHAHQQAIAQNSILENNDPVIGPIRTARPAWRMGRTSELLHDTAPQFGQHTDSVLSELGYSSDAVAKLRTNGVIA
tara:strand:- start:79 stop:1191 length:1113 start_codon:yes stop_codon:yes gene_type:complete